jgi:hypothetical protein
MNAALLDTSIPILTEVITSPSAEAAPAASDPVEMLAPPPAELELPDEKTEPAGAEPEPDWSAIERDVSLRVLGQLQGRIDFVLEHRVRDSLADVLQTAVESLAAEIRRGLQQTLEEVVKRAVAQEITHIQSSRK